MPKKNRDLGPKLDEAIYNLRVAGISERAIYEELRERLDTAPSYRDVRASLAKQGVRYRADATARRRDGDYHTASPHQKPLAHVDYEENREVTRRVDKTADAMERLNRNYVLGMLARAGVDPTTISVDTDDGKFYRESLEHIYRGQGS